MRFVNDELEIQPQCASMHVAPWLAEPRWLHSMVNAYRAGLLVPHAGKVVADASTKKTLYTVNDEGIATFELNGALMKGESKFGPSTSTVRMRRAVRMAASDDSVKGGIMLIDSPGGTVSGTDELAADLRGFASSKPLHVHAEGEMDSAAYWLGIQGDRVGASRMSNVGSIGAIMVIDDTSGMYEAKGIKVHVLTNAEASLKGSFADGAPVSEAALEYGQEIVDEAFAAFKSAVIEARALTGEQFDAVASGRVWKAPQAKRMGLIDSVQTLDQAYAALRADIRGRDRDRAAAQRSAAARASAVKGRVLTSHRPAV